MMTPERPDEVPVAPSPPVVVPAVRVTRATWAVLIGAAVVAGLGSWLATEGVFRRYETVLRGGKSQPTEEDTRKILEARVECGAISFAATGAIFGLALGLAGGIARRSIGAALASGAAGALLGLLLEGGVGRLIVGVVYHTFDPMSQDLLMPMLAHLGLWCASGAVAGLAFGLGIGGKGRWWRSMLGGIVGAGLATVAFELIGALAFPTDGTHLPHADTVRSRALAQLLMALGAGLGAVLAIRETKPKPIKA